MGDTQTLLQATLSRLNTLADIGNPLIVCGTVFGVQAKLQAFLAGFPDVATLLEPEGRNTAPAICAAALMVERTCGADAIILTLPADHVIADGAAFAAAVASGAELAARKMLVTFAITARTPATEYGYLKLGETIDCGKRQQMVDAFVEKPSPEKAQAFLAAGQYAWNSGMFMFTAAAIIENFARLQPDILSACRKSLPANPDTPPFRLNKKEFEKAEAISIDVAIMERAENVAAVVVDMGWSDVGSWDSIWQASSKPVAGNATQGNVHLHDCKDSIVQSGGPLLVALGLESMIAVATDDAILVAPRSRSQEVKKVIEEQAQSRHGGSSNCRKALRAWGWIRSLRAGTGVDVNEIAVYPGSSASLPGRDTQAVQWICTTGSGVFTLGDESMDLHADRALRIPAGVTRKLENTGSCMLYIIEVQVWRPPVLGAESDAPRKRKTPKISE